jgi:hypothetical protein
MTNRKPMLWASLTVDSTREEVLAAVEECDERSRLAREHFDSLDWSHLPPEGERRGCYWSKDGSVKVHYGAPREEDPILAAQRLAGEEDQSTPGWDQGA